MVPMVEALPGFHPCRTWLVVSLPFAKSSPIRVILVENFLPPDHVDLGGSYGEPLGDELVCFVRVVKNVKKKFYEVFAPGVVTILAFLFNPLYNPIHPLSFMLQHVVRST